MLHTLVVRMQWPGANCTLGALVEMDLAEKLTRQRGRSEKRLVDRQMEGLLMAVLSLTVMASEWVQRQRWEPAPVSPRSSTTGHLFGTVGTCAPRSKPTGSVGP